MCIPVKHSVAPREVLATTPSLPQPSCLSAPSTTTTTTKKRGVRFLEDNTPCRRVKRCVVELNDVPTSSDMTEEERAARWRRRSDHIDTFHDVEQIVLQCQQEDEEKPDAYLNFAKHFATAYNLCHAESDCDNNDGEEDIDEANAQRGLPLDHMILRGDSHTCTRGLEVKIMPGLGAHRVQKKQEFVRGLLSVQSHLKAIGAANASEGLAAVSKCLSAPSRRFARALGVVDGTLALLEYAAPSPIDESLVIKAQSSEQQAFCVGF